MQTLFLSDRPIVSSIPRSALRWRAFFKPALYSPPQHSTMRIKLSEKDREALHQVKGLLENTGVHFTIPQLVRRSGMNADKLKKGFKEMFGMPVHRYHLPG
jgi:AraC-like DNA-binding protein